jgi:hypothetical protein
MNVEVLAEKIAERVVERVLVRLGRLPAEPERPTAYTTHKSGPHLPGKTRRWMLDHARNIPGAKKVGRDWVISVEDYEAWCKAEDTRRCAGKRDRAVRAPAPPTKVRSSVVDMDRKELERRIDRSIVASGNRRSK